MESEHDIFKMQNKYLHGLDVDIPESTYLKQFEKKKRHITKNMRLIIIDWLFEISIRYLNINNHTLGLSITLFDNYISKVNIKKDDIQITVIACMSLTENILNDMNVTSIKDYIHITEKTFTREQLEITKDNIFRISKGTLIRPSTVFLIDMNNEKLKYLAMMSYFSYKLVIYNPSLIAESINYLIYGTHTLYSLEEVCSISHILISEIHKFIKSKYNNIKTISTKAKSFLNDISIREDINTLRLKERINKYPEPFVINNYELLEIIGEGVYGKVVKIRMNDKELAIKSSTNKRENALIEISILKQLNSDYCIKLLGCELYVDRVDIYLPYFKYTLGNLLDDNKLDRSKILYYAKQMVLGLQECHSNDIIHRDIKLSNIIYDDENDRFKLIDFGLSVAYSSLRKNLDPKMACTFQYKSPEILINEYNYDYKVDIWALGVIFYLIITHEYIFKYDNINNIDALTAIFQRFGMPKDWSKMDTFIKENKMSSYPGIMIHIKRILSIYNDFVMACLEMNPCNRATTSQLLEILDT